MLVPVPVLSAVEMLNLSKVENLCQNMKMCPSQSPQWWFVPVYFCFYFYFSPSHNAVYSCTYLFFFITR